MNITFEESNHLYKTVDDENFKWISATTFISKFHEEFDQEKMARQCSEKKSGKYKGMTPESIIEAWEEESARACEMGTRYHARRELETLNCKTIAINGIDVPVYHNVTTDDGKKVSTSQVLNEGVYPEFLLYLKTAGICGQADRVEVVGNKLNIKDYKSNKHIDKESFSGRNGKKYMFVPLKHLEDCNFNHYQLQLSLYMYILQKHNPQLEPGTLEIHHVEFEKSGETKLGFPIYQLDSDGDPIVKKLTIYECTYLKNEIKAMIDYSKLHPEILL